MDGKALLVLGALALGGCPKGGVMSESEEDTKIEGEATVLEDDATEPSKPDAEPADDADKTPPPLPDEPKKAEPAGE